MAEKDPRNATGRSDDELSVEELETASGGVPLSDVPSDDINTNCGGNCNCQPGG